MTSRQMSRRLMRRSASTGLVPSSRSGGRELPNRAKMLRQAGRGGAAPLPQVRAAGVKQPLRSTSRRRRQREQWQGQRRVLMPWRELGSAMVEVGPSPSRREAHSASRHAHRDGLVGGAPRDVLVKRSPV